LHYAVVVEKAANNCSAYLPDLPGCTATGFTIEETEREIREAIEFHTEGMIDDGLPVPRANQHYSIYPNRCLNCLSTGAQPLRGMRPVTQSRTSRCSIHIETYPKPCGRIIYPVRLCVFPNETTSPSAPIAAAIDVRHRNPADNVFW
jgi:predicted RNase H-like HicB family nuclease